MSYADITIHDRNPVKRWLQRRRFSDALATLPDARDGVQVRMLDFGAGDGELVRQIAGAGAIEAFVYEPTPHLMAEAKAKLAGLNNVVFAERLESVASGAFDYVFCLEVFEHLPEREAIKAIAEIHRLLKPDGVAVVGVPHELFLPALIKGAFRMFRRYGDFDASPGNIIRATFGRPPAERPVVEISPGQPYHLHHLGFDHRVLERLFRERLELTRKWFGPVPAFGAVLNSEVHFLLRKSPRRDAARAPQPPLRSAGDAHSHFMHGNALIAQGRADDAIVSYQTALALQPEFPEALSNLGNLLKDQGRLHEALACYEKAVRLCPGFAEAQFNLGLACQELGRNVSAMACFEAAVAIRPEFTEAQYSLGYLYANEDRRSEALACFDRALSQDPGFAEARWAKAMAQLLAVCGPDDDATRGRAAFAAELQALDRWFEGPQAAAGAKAVGSLQPFRLAYHEENNRDLLARYGGLCARLMQQWLPRELAQPVARGTREGALRVAIVSGHLRNHSVWHAIAKGWFRQIDRNRFTLSAFFAAAGEDDETRLARSCAAHFEQGPRTLRQWVEAVLAQRPDVILYPEIGMDPMTLRLASLRLAPVQAAAWGHPETSGLPTIDYFLSSEDFEPEGAQAHYTERLVRLPHLGCYVEPFDAGATAPDFSAWGLDEDVPLLLCPGTPFKYAPGHDVVLTRIASRLGKCQFAFFTHHVRGLSDRLRQRLAAEFRRSGLDPAAHLRFLPWLDTPAFHGLMQRADLCLDSIGFSGFNTAMQTVECELPLVTREGRFMRGRFASAILRRLGLPELVAATEDEYVALAVKLIEDASFRRDVRARLAAQRAVLFRDEAPIRALEQFLVSATGAAAR